MIEILLIGPRCHAREILGLVSYIKKIGKSYHTQFTQNKFNKLDTIKRDPGHNNGRAK